jgi:hypothetical protein
MPAGKPLKARLPLAAASRDLAGSKGTADAAEPNPNHDLLNKTEAINRALQSWNDQEVLRLMRLHWRQIARFVKAHA